MRLLIHETLATAAIAAPLAAGWVVPSAELTVETRPEVRGDDLAPTDLALLPSPEIALLQETHQIVPDLAMIAGAVGPVSLRTPVRPDEVERGPVRLVGTSGAGEFLARATLRPFYGIEATRWVTDADDPAAMSAQAVVVEGFEALRPPEGGFAEDLCRAWFVLTGTAVVTHLLVAPLAADRETLRPALATLAALREGGRERRGEWRRALAAAHELPLDRLHALFAEQRLTLEQDDRRALSMLLARGARGSGYPPTAMLRFLEPEPAPDRPAGEK